MARTKVTATRTIGGTAPAKRMAAMSVSSVYRNYRTPSPEIVSEKARIGQRRQQETYRGKKGAEGRTKNTEDVKKHRDRCTFTEIIEDKVKADASRKKYRDTNHEKINEKK